ncbi:MAG TPA: multicopper oxidase domain-containing protein, partial [Bacilli bacterium]
MRKGLWIFGVFIILISVVGSAYMLFPIEKQAVDAHDGQDHGNHAAAIEGEAAAFDPYFFDYGKISTTENGQTVKEFEITAEDKILNIEGMEFPVWTYNGSVPGPTIRVTEGDIVKINFTNNGSMPHTIHLHGIHP